VASRQPFTPASLDNLKSGSLTDPQTPGLVIEVGARGKKTWKYRRRLPDQDVTVKMTLGSYPAYRIGDAREWARELNSDVETGIDPREALREAAARAEMTVARAHALYMTAAREGRASRAKRLNKPRTIKDKQDIYDRDIAPTLGAKIIYEVTEKDLIKLVSKKGETAKVRANRLAAELKVFFGWAAGLRGLVVGLENDPSRRLGDLKFVETRRTRKLDLDEIRWFLQAVALEKRDFRRGLILSLLTATRISELVKARSSEIENGVWTIPAARSKNSTAHAIALGPWGQRLFASNHEWVFPAERVEGPRTTGWYKARDRVLARMEKIADRPVDRFCPHDFRRTARSNTKRLKVDFETAEAMLNHLKVGMERIYDGYELEEEKAAWFLKWEREIIQLAEKAGVAAELEVPVQPKRAVKAPSGRRRCTRRS